jgi:peptidylprolyl isomerase
MEQAKSGDTVRVHYTGKFEDGTVFDSTQGENPLEFTLGTAGLIYGFQQAVLGMSPGESKTEWIPNQLAYGPYQEALCLEVDRAIFAEERVTPEVGMQLEVRDLEGKAMPVQVTDVSDTNVKLDANHPLAGKDLVFDINLIEIVENSRSSSDRLE